MVEIIRQIYIKLIYIFPNNLMTILKLNKTEPLLNDLPPLDHIVRNKSDKISVTGEFQRWKTRRE